MIDFSPEVYQSASEPVDSLGCGMDVGVFTHVPRELPHMQNNSATSWMPISPAVSHAGSSGEQMSDFGSLLHPQPQELMQGYADGFQDFRDSSLGSHAPHFKYVI